MDWTHSLRLIPRLCLAATLMASTSGHVDASTSGSIAMTRERVIAARELMTAVMSGDPKKVEKVGPAASGLAIFDPLGFTPLIWASAQRSPKIVDLLLQQGHSPNLVSPNTGWTPLMMAATYGNTQIVDLLLKAGANPAAAANDGSTAESLAKAKGNQFLADRIAKAVRQRSARRKQP